MFVQVLSQAHEAHHAFPWCRIAQSKGTVSLLSACAGRIDMMAALQEVMGLVSTTIPVNPPTQKFAKKTFDLVNKTITFTGYATGFSVCTADAFECVITASSPPAPTPHRPSF